jgi:hypothetical protein
MARLEEKDDEVCSSPYIGWTLEDRLAERTAFVARFVVLREGKRSRAHRKIERMVWGVETTARDLALAFKIVFLQNGDRSPPVDRDLRRALLHAQRAHRFFRLEYAKRSTDSFVDALVDYERSNVLLFGSIAGQRPGGWRPAKELLGEAESLSVSQLLSSAGALLAEATLPNLEGEDDDDSTDSEDELRE